MTPRLSLAERIQRELEQQEGLRVNVSLTEASVRLSGTVDSSTSRQRAEEIAADLAPNRRIENDIDVSGPVQDEMASDEAIEYGEAYEPTFATGEPYGDATEAAEEESKEPVFPATDPVVDRDQVIGGYSTTSMDSLEIAPSAENRLPGDEALAEAIRRELREDAATTDFHIDVEVEAGVAHLHGTVPGIEDVENVEEVAGRLPGVREVIEHLDVTG